MKPSEYLKKKLKDCSDKNYFERLEELDLKYIDREELKDKIKKLNYSLDIRDKMPYKQKVYLEEVLELLEE